MKNESSLEQTTNENQSDDKSLNSYFKTLMKTPQLYYGIVKYVLAFNDFNIPGENIIDNFLAPSGVTADNLLSAYLASSGMTDVLFAASLAINSETRIKEFVGRLPFEAYFPVRIYETFLKNKTSL